MTISLDRLLDWFNELQRVYGENKAYLTELDAAIGDADHGINMDRGFTAVKNELREHRPADTASALKSAAMVLIRTVGGAAGPLYGTFFLRASAARPNVDEISAADLIEMFQAGVEGVIQRGKAEPNDKTMVDALNPALEAMRKALENGGGLVDTLRAGMEAAEQGMKDTIPLIARKGRASYLGERSVGHQDPGATSSYLLFKAAYEVWGKE